MSNPTALVQKLCNYCNILRDDGFSYGDYVEQLTFLLFRKTQNKIQDPAKLRRQRPLPASAHANLFKLVVVPARHRGKN